MLGIALQLEMHSTSLFFFLLWARHHNNKNSPTLSLLMRPSAKLLNRVRGLHRIVFICIRILPFSCGNAITAMLRVVLRSYTISLCFAILFTYVSLSFNYAALPVAAAASSSSITSKLFRNQVRNSPKICMAFATCTFSFCR
ncbi:hypothetical protein V8C37DRAFT_155945 [Trichoderma ceciliae]